MAVLALVGITGMYLSQIRRYGVLGLVGYVVLAAGLPRALPCAKLSHPGPSAGAPFDRSPAPAVISPSRRRGATPPPCRQRVWTCSPATGSHVLRSHRITTRTAGDDLGRCT
jgi:hypothetical protein